MQITKEENAHARRVPNAVIGIINLAYSYSFYSSFSFLPPNFTSKYGDLISAISFSFSVVAWVFFSLGLSVFSFSLSASSSVVLRANEDVEDRSRRNTKTHERPRIFSRNNLSGISKRFVVFSKYSAPERSIVKLVKRESRGGGGGRRTR